MRFCLGYPIIALDPDPRLLTNDSVGRITTAAESSGFSAISFTEHPGPPSSWRDDHGHDALDPFVSLAVAGARSATIRLLTYLTVVPYRNPFLLAKTAATLDRLSGGRLILGVGAGYLRGEFRALGVDFAERNELMDEAIEVMHEAWTGKPVHRVGRHFVADGVVAVPAPVQSPIPIWVGGNSARARRRVAEYGHGWMPIPTTGPQVERRGTAALESLDDLAALIKDVGARCAANKRDVRPEVMYHIDDIDSVAEPRRYLERVEMLAAAGVTWVTVDIGGGTVAELEERVEIFGERVIRPAGNAGSS